MTRQWWSSARARRLLRLPGWVAAVAVAFLVGAVVGPIAVSAHPLGSTSGQSLAATASRANFPHMDHIFIIMMENTEYQAELSHKNPYTRYVQHLAATDGLATNYFGITHTSLPNYIGATSGSTWGSNNDDVLQAPYFNHENLVDQFEAAHVSWKAYMQSIPYPGDTVTETPNGLYVRKHDPFLMYPDVFKNRARADRVVPLTQLGKDLASGHVPQYAWISPNICDDMHGGAPACPYPSSPSSPAQAKLFKDGNAFIQKWVGLITHSSAWTGHSAIFILWDEGGYEDVSPYGPEDNRPGPDSPVLPATPVNPKEATGGDLYGGTVYGGGHIPMIAVVQGVGHRVDKIRSDNYSLLRTVEENFGLPLLGYASDSVQVTSLYPLLK
jgi:phosphatidylinositol-3-phosphatase